EERLANLDPGVAANAPAELHDRPGRLHRALQRFVHGGRVRLRVVGEVHGVGGTAPAGGEVSPELLGHERREGSQQARDRDEALVQREEGRLRVRTAAPVRIPEATPRAPYV